MADGRLEVETLCPHCGGRFDRAYEATDLGGQPEDGDKVLCVVCGSWSLWDYASLGQLRIPSAEEMVMISQSRGAIKAVVAMETYRKTGRMPQ